MIFELLFEFGPSRRRRIPATSDVVDVFSCPDSSGSSPHEGQGPSDACFIILELVLLTGEIEFDLVKKVARFVGRSGEFRGWVKLYFFVSGHAIRIRIGIGFGWGRFFR